MARLTFLSATVVVVAACSDCHLDKPVGASITCQDVLGGEYKACHGPAWEEATTNWCSTADYYLLQVGRPYPEGGTIVVKEYRIPIKNAIIRDYLIFERQIVEENLDTKEICFRATEPPTCYAPES